MSPPPYLKSIVCVMKVQEWVWEGLGWVKFGGQFSISYCSYNDDQGLPVHHTCIPH
jgi:hypothetical protein